MLKKELRKLYREKRNEVSPTEKLRWDDLLLIRFQTIELPYISHVLSFYPIEENNEVNTFHITDYLRFRNPGLNICYPRTDMQNHTMQAVVCHPDSIFESNAWNIPEPLDETIAEPSEIDLVIVPMLICDSKGNRVGYGKGFYDRYLAQCGPDCIKIGFSYFEPVEAVDDTGEFDVPLDFCITPERAYVF
jgi:5-formyltetrahydrofolate cyclo-ligase